MDLKKTFIIAEIGKNFIQTEEPKSVATYLENAKELVKQAKQAGVDAVKFQTHVLEDEQLDIHVVSEHFKSSDRYTWVKRNMESTPIEEFWKPLKKYCDEIGVTFFSTPMSRGAAKILDQLGVNLWKVGSGDILDFVLLDYIAKTNKPLIISSGMSTLEEINLMVKFLNARNVEFYLLHCVSQYPCPPEELNLGTIEFFQDEFSVPVGFSDHSIGIDSAIAAVSMGAKIIEKHFSLSREFWGSDHKVSLLPEEMSELVTKIRLLEKGQYTIDKGIIERSYGKKEKIMDNREAVFRQWFRKSLMAGKNIEKGHALSADDIFAMRPQKFAKGVPSQNYEFVLGKRINRSLKKYEPITLDLFDK